MKGAKKKTMDMNSLLNFHNSTEYTNNERKRITERYDEQNRHEMGQAKDFFTFIHDRKNPLMTTKGYVSRLLLGKVGPLTKKQKEYLEIIHYNHENIEALFKQFFDILRSRSKNLKPVLNTFDIIPVMSKIIDAVTLEAVGKGIRICFEHPQTMHSLYTDETLMIRIVRNLLDNALKYTPSGGTITVKVSDRDDDFLIRIGDTGNGIPNRHIPYIFSPFYQVRRDSRGSGLGLYIVKQLIDLLGGKIWVESIPGRGTSFSLTLPKYQGEQSAVSEMKEERLYCFEQEYPAQGSCAYKQDMVAEKQEFRCSKCNQLLAKANGKGNIAGLRKCTRCGNMNEI